jgi:class III poly(R)-hydroxyalkanoic acid synthase PhaE subunit
MEKAYDFFDTWLKAQEKFIQGWTETSKKMQQSLSGLGVSSAGKVKETMNAATETATKLISSSTVLRRLSEIYLPLLSAIQERAGNIDFSEDLFDPAKYKEVMDSLFGLSSPEAMAEFYGQTVKLLQAYGASTIGFVGPWTEAMQKNMKVMPQLAEGRPESFMHIFHNMFSAVDSTFGKVFHVPAVGKDREKINLLLRAFDDLAVNMAKNIEYQHMIYVTGMAAMEIVIEAVARKIKSGEEIKGFDEFLDLWVDSNEKRYRELFQTEEFSRLQGELTESTLRVRKHLFKLMELYLYDFPIALRSEMDDLYKTIYDLKKKVKGLEKQMKVPKGVSVEEVTT